MSTPSSAALPALSIPEPSRGYRFLIGCAIVAGLSLVLYAALHGELFRPIKDAVDEGSISEALLRPSMLWAAMGLLMLTLRTALWFRYTPHAPAQYSDAPTLTVVIARRMSLFLPRTCLGTPISSSSCYCMAHSLQKPSRIEAISPLRELSTETIPKSIDSSNRHARATNPLPLHDSPHTRHVRFAATFRNR